MKYKIIIILCVYNLSASGQFTGGDSDGAISTFLDFETALYHGGGNDGHSYVDISESNSIYFGSEGDGHSTLVLVSSDGIYYGSISDGHAVDSWNTNQNIYTGSAEDGQDMNLTLRTYIWSGDVGTGWNVADNWTNDAIPRLRHSVILPNDRPNYPKLNSGIFATKKILTTANFFCKNIQIANNAELTFRLNCFVENYGKIHNYGTVFGLNPSLDAIRNLTGGEIRLFSGAEFLRI